MWQKKYIAVLSLAVMLTSLSFGGGSLVGFQSVVSSSAATSNQTNIGLWCQGSGCFDGAFSLSDMDAFYYATFGTGNFNSLVMYTNEGPGYIWYSAGDTIFPDQVQELSLDSQKYGGNIKMIFEIAMDYNYNGTVSNGCNPNVFIYNSTDYCNPEYTQLRNFLLQDAKYPALYALGINFERAQFGCDYSFSACGWLHGESVFGNSYVNQSMNFYANMVQHWGKQFISTGAEHSGTTINPGPGKNWNEFCGADSVNNYPNPSLDVGTVGAGYWYAGCHGSKQISGTSSYFVYVGITDGMFQSYDQPARYYESQISDGVTYPNVPAGTSVIVYNGTAGARCTWTPYSDTHNLGQTSPGCAPSGQWNGNSINWWFQQENSVFIQYPSNRQFALMGIDYMINQTGQELLYSRITSPYKYWNSVQFECSVQSAESTSGFTTPSNVTMVTALSCPTGSSTTRSSQTSSSTSSTSTTSSRTTTSTTSSTLSGNTSAGVSTDASSYLLGAMVNWNASGLTSQTSDSARLALFFTNGTEIKVEPYTFQPSSLGTATGNFTVPQYSNLTSGFVKLEDQYSNTIVLSSTFDIYTAQSSASNTSATSTFSTTSATSTLSTTSTTFSTQAVSTTTSTVVRTTLTSTSSNTSNSSTSILTSSSANSSTSSLTTHTNHSGGNNPTSSNGNNHKKSNSLSKFSTTSSGLTSQSSASAGVFTILSPSNLLSALSPSGDPAAVYGISISAICLIGGLIITTRNLHKRKTYTNARSWRW